MKGRFFTTACSPADNSPLSLEYVSLVLLPSPWTLPSLFLRSLQRFAMFGDFIIILRPLLCSLTITVGHHPDVSCVKTPRPSPLSPFFNCLL